MHPDEHAFHARIAANPDDNTARLVYADWLDEHDQPERAEYIRGCIRMYEISPTGRPVPRDLMEEWYTLNDRMETLLAEHRPAWTTYPCPVCPPNRTVDGCPCGGSGDLFLPFGDGAIRRNAVFERGLVVGISCGTFDELCGAAVKFPESVIRSQIAWRGIIPMNTRRADKLLKRYRTKWEKCPCPACFNVRKVEKFKLTNCSVCGGSGDLLKFSNPRGRDDYSRNPTFRRGFVDSVECRLEEIGSMRNVPPFPRNPQSYTERKFVAHPWAAAVVRALPVTRFRITDVPFMEPGRYEFRLRQNGGILPQVIEDEIFGHDASTPDAALDALAVAACCVVRRAVYGGMS